MQTFQPDRATRRLIDALLDATISFAQFDELAGSLSASAELRDWYCQYAGLHGLLAAELRKVPEFSPQPELPANRPPALSVLGFLGETIARVPGGEFVVGGLVLLAVSAAVWGVVHFTRVGRESADVSLSAADSERSLKGSVGSLAADAAADWSEQSKPTGAGVHTGQSYELLAGWARIELARGTSLAVAGPARWRLETDARLRLELGSLIARVPKDCVGFTVVTPTAEVVDLGTEFGVEVDAQGSTDLHVLRGRVELKSKPAPAAPSTSPRQVIAGQAIRVSSGGGVTVPIALDPDRFAAARAAKTRPLVPAAEPVEPLAKDQPIWLGNLFDDFAFTGVPVASALKTDVFRAKAEVYSLGVDRIYYGGSSVKEIAPGVRFDAAKLGWQDIALLGGHVTNDAWSDADLFVDQNGQRGGIRTRGQPMGYNEPRIEEGIGEHANSLITFDLDKIRAAAGLAGQALEFRCDRAGINDACIGDVGRGDRGTVYLTAIASGADGVQAVLVNGRPAKTAPHDDVWQLKDDIGEPLKANGHFVSFELSLPPAARWLTLLAAGAGDDHVGDHAVWSGARLEVR